MGFSDWLILGFVALSLWAGHYFPWHILPGFTDKLGELRRVPAYVYGVVCLNIGMVLWCYGQGNYAPAAFLFMLSIAAGIGTIGPRLVEREHEYQAMEEDRRDGTP